ncbi:MAG TPA: alpha/beta fold hydrolase, partial [Terriglobales bacterium]|nr:alpha/beta fold hydrolase [Terriglobales bacterium]
MKHTWTLLAAFCAVAAMAGAQTSPAGGQRLTIEKIFAEGGITGRAPSNLQWSPDGKKVSFVQRDASGEHGALWYVDASTGKKAILVAEDKLATLAPPVSRIKSEREKTWIQRYNVAAYHWAPDSKHLLFDSMGQLWYYSLDSGTAVQVTTAPQATGDPKFSPDGKRISYIREHNIYVRPLETGSGEKEVSEDANPKIKKHELTSGTKTEDLLNGEVDWVYAEELDVRSNYFWEPGGRHIAFLQMNEQNVPTYPLTELLDVQASVEKENYPKPGDLNPEVRLGVVGSDGGHVKWISLGKDQDIYIPRFGWIRDGWLWAEVLNRAQNKLDLYFVDAASGKARRVLEESNPSWVEVNDDFQILKSGDRFLWSSWRTGYTHLYLYSFNMSNPAAGEARLERQLENGDYEVTGVDGLDEAAGWVYFTANKDDARERQLYRVKLDGSGVGRISREAGTHEANFAEDARHYVDGFSSLQTPPVMSFCGVDGKCEQFWASNEVKEYALTPPKFVNFKAEDGTVLYGILWLPENAATASAGSVPLILNPYGGPHAQDVTNAWRGAFGLFNQILLQHGFAVLTVDNRGMGGRGEKFAAANFHHFGDTELKDQLGALDQALQQYPMLDRNRLGWWGWSYGGYFTLYAMTHSDRFQAGISVAPVTNWLLYDSIYTERYMGLPRDNSGGYRASSPVNNAGTLHGHLLEAHGTGDDNV